MLLSTRGKVSSAPKLMSRHWVVYSVKKYTVFNVHGSVHRKNILIYIQQDATLHSLFYLETALHVSGGSTTHHQERKQLHQQLLMMGAGTTRNM